MNQNYAVKSLTFYILHAIMIIEKGKTESGYAKRDFI